MNWLQYFQHNREHRRPIPWELGIHISAKLHRPLIHSLQRFQIGESGEGLHLRRYAATTRNPTYEAAIDLFIKEEQEHARLMACVLEQLHGPLLSRHWSDVCFMALRRPFGLRTELLVLLVAEMIARRYFRALKEGTDDPVLVAVFGQILHDEEGHLAFHAAYLNREFASRPFAQRLLTLMFWRMLFRAACAVVILDHRHVLREVGVSRADFRRDCGDIFDEMAARIFSPAHVLCEPTPATPIP